MNTESNWCGIDHTKSKQCRNFILCSTVHKLWSIASETSKPLTLGEAYFKQMKDGSILTVPYDFIHVTPPQRPIPVLREAGDDLTVGGFVAVNKVNSKFKRT